MLNWCYFYYTAAIWSLSCEEYLCILSPPSHEARKNAQGKNNVRWRRWSAGLILGSTHHAFPRWQKIPLSTCTGTSCWLSSLPSSNGVKVQAAARKCSTSCKWKRSLWDSKLGPRWGALQSSNALSYQVSSLVGCAPVHWKATCPMPIVVDHWELNSSLAQNLSLHSHTLPGWPQAHLHLDILSSLQWGLKGAASVKDVSSSARVRGETPAPLFPGSPQRHPVYPWVDVS